jgi:hypothetical protein
MGTSCPNGCGEYINLAKHWSGSKSCDYPELTDFQIDVIEGLIMGDASINHQSDEWNARLDLSVVSEDFAKKAQDDLSWLSNSVSVREKGGISKNPQHRLITYCHPKLSEIYKKWYPNGKKRFPNSLQLNETKLTYWYLGDGSLSFNRSGSAYARIRCNNESDRQDYLEGLFSDIGITAYASSDEVRISTGDTDKFLDIVQPVDDLSYKWETDKDRFDNIKRPYYKGTSTPPDV